MHISSAYLQWPSRSRAAEAEGKNVDGDTFCHAVCPSGCKTVRTKGDVPADETQHQFQSCTRWALTKSEAVGAGLPFRRQALSALTPGPELQQRALTDFEAIGPNLQIPWRNIFLSHSNDVSTPAPAE